MEGKETEQQKKEETKQQETTQNQEQDIDDLDAGLDDFDDDNKLDVTASEKDHQEDDDFDPQTDKEFQDFMKQMQQGMGLEGGVEGMKDMEKMMQGLLGGLGGGEQGGEGQQQQGGNMDDMFKNMENNPNLDNLADHLLKEFMEKDILEEPLKEAKENYSKYLEENDEKLSDEDKDKYVNQMVCIEDILQILETDPNNKEAMIEKFEKIQEYGAPPAELLANFGSDSPFAMFGQGGNNPFAGMMGGQQQQGQQGEQGQMPPCNIF